MGFDCELHISSKELPNWLWCTFEHIDNPLRGQVLGCNDNFGATPANNCRTAPSKALLDLFKADGLGPEWQNYRLDGAQIAYVASNKVPTRLGNSILEGGFVATASCITCHAEASMDTTGNFKSLSLSTGEPNPAWYQNPPKMKLDFVWSFTHAAAAPSAGGNK